MNLFTLITTLPCDVLINDELFFLKVKVNSNISLNPVKMLLWAVFLFCCSKMTTFYDLKRTLLCEIQIQQHLGIANNRYILIKYQVFVVNFVCWFLLFFLELQNMKNIDETSTSELWYEYFLLSFGMIFLITFKMEPILPVSRKSSKFACLPKPILQRHHTSLCVLLYDLAM